MSRYREPLFPVSVFHGTVEDNDRIKELMLPLIKENSGKHKVPPDGWLTNKLTTSFDDQEFGDMLKGNSDVALEIRNQYIKAMSLFFNTTFSCAIEDMWYNSYSDGEYQEAHTHFGSYKTPNHYACVHFLNFDTQNHQPLTFLDPLRHIRASSHEFSGFGGYYDHYRVKAKEGDIVMFPAYLEHEVKPGKPTPEYPRITMSFNIRIESFGDEEDGGNDGQE